MHEKTGKTSRLCEKTNHGGEAVLYKEKLAAVCFFSDAGTVTHNHFQVSSDGRTSDCI